MVCCCYSRSNLLDAISLTKRKTKGATSVCLSRKRADLDRSTTQRKRQRNVKRYRKQVLKRGREWNRQIDKSEKEIENVEAREDCVLSALSNGAQPFNQVIFSVVDLNVVACVIHTQTQLRNGSRSNSN